MRVLVVDDNAANLDLMLYLLRAFGHEAEGKSEAPAGLEAAREGHFSVVLTDLLMPAIDGFEFARRFKAQPALASTPLIAVSALAMQADRDRAAAAGFDGYITKPIDPQTFVAEIEGVVSRGSG
jgi:two-component system, cell cycle response regulator